MAIWPVGWAELLKPNNVFDRDMGCSKSSHCVEGLDGDKAGGVTRNNFAVMLAFLVLLGCRTRLTAGGQDIIIVKKIKDLPAGCVRLESYSAHSKFGTTKALNSIRNKVAAIGNADALLISSIQHGAPPSSRVSVISYNCHLQTPSTAGADQEGSSVHHDFTKKCKLKGGEWIDGQCVIKLDDE